MLFPTAYKYAKKGTISTLLESIRGRRIGKNGLRITWVLLLKLSKTHKWDINNVQVGSLDSVLIAQIGRMKSVRQYHTTTYLLAVIVKQ